MAAGDNCIAPIFDDEKVADDIVAQADEIAGDGMEEEGDDAVVQHTGGTSSSVRAKPFFNIIEVLGAAVPSDNAKFSGNTPSVAARKAARRIWKRSNKEEFDIIMRKVSKVTSGRVLYKYHAQVVGRKEPIAFFAAKAATFENIDGTISKIATKRIHIARNPSSPMYGCIDADGGVIACTKAELGENRGTLHRTKGTNTLVLAIADGVDIPTKIGPHNVVRDDHIINVQKAVITDSESLAHDVAGAAKAATKAAAKELREKEKEKKAKAKQDAKEAARKANAAAKQAAKKAKPASNYTKRSMTGGASTSTASTSPGDARTSVRNADGAHVKSDTLLTFSH